MGNDYKFNNLNDFCIDLSVLIFNEYLVEKIWVKKLKNAPAIRS